MSIEWWCARVHFGPVWAVMDNGTTKQVLDAEGHEHLFWSKATPGVRPPVGLPDVVGHQFARDWQRCEFDPGVHHPRIWRGELSPGPREYEREWSSCYGAVSSLVRRMVEIFRFIEPRDGNLDAFGHETRQLLIIAATEVEASWRSILVANGYQSGATDLRLSTNDYAKLADPLKLREWALQLNAYPDAGEFAPFATWDVTRPTKSLAWYDAYNSVKHDRDTSFAAGNVRAAITAVSAAYILVLAQFGEVDNRHFLGLDEFRRVRVPKFALSESYVPPAVARSSAWSAQPLFP